MERPKFTPEEAINPAEEEEIELTDEDFEDVTDQAEVEIALQEIKGGQVATFKDTEKKKGPPPIPEKAKTLKETLEAAQRMPDNAEDIIGDLVEEATGIDSRPRDPMAESVMAGLRVDRYKQEAAEAAKRAEQLKLDKEIEEALVAVEEAADDDVDAGEERKAA